VIAELSGGDLLVSGSLQLFVGVVDPSLNVIAVSSLGYPGCSLVGAAAPPPPGQFGEQFGAAGFGLERLAGRCGLDDGSVGKLLVAPSVVEGFESTVRPDTRRTLQAGVVALDPLRHPLRRPRLHHAEDRRRSSGGEPRMLRPNYCRRGTTFSFFGRRATRSAPAWPWFAVLPCWVHEDRSSSLQPCLHSRGRGEDARADGPHTRPRCSRLGWTRHSRSSATSSRVSTHIVGGIDI